jgi:hypothetical protein
MTRYIESSGDDPTGAGVYVGEPEFRMLGTDMRQLGDVDTEEGEEEEGTMDKKQAIT